MTRVPGDITALTGLLDETVALLRKSDPAVPRARRAGVPTGARLPSLIGQLREVVAAADGDAGPVRTLHHMACSGGTLIAKCLALQPNVLLLSEIDPLSRLGIDPRRPVFAPSDMIRQIRQTPRGLPDAALAEIFAAELRALADICARRGLRLVLRDHAHSHFCHGAEIPDRPGLRDLVARDHALRPAVTVRHPLDCFLGLIEHGWRDFSPPTLAEYARRHLAFLDAHAGARIFRYEDFVADPETVLRALCAELGLVCAGHRPELLEAVRLTGDSGRGGSRIASRPRRPLPGELEVATGNCAAYQALCVRLGYDPRPAAPPVSE